MDTYLTVEEIAESLKMPIETIRVWLRNGKLKGIRIGKYWRVKETDFKDFIAEQRGGK